MKHQQVVVDYWKMVKTSGMFLLLAISGYVLIKMVQTIFWLPHYLEKNQKRLEELAETYAINLKDPSAKEPQETLEEQPKAVEADQLEPEAKKDK